MDLVLYCTGVALLFNGIIAVCPPSKDAFILKPFRVMSVFAVPCRRGDGS